MEEPIKRRARTRRRNFLILKENLEKEVQKKIENIEQQTQNSEKLITEHNFETSKSKLESDKTSAEELNISSFLSSKTNSSISENLTYSISKNSDSEHHTYTLKEPEELVSDQEANRPVPAPRKRNPKTSEPEKVSSDTDKDVIEIDIDEIAIKSDHSELLNSATTKFKTPTFLQDSTKSDSVVIPVPKPRKNSSNFRSVFEQKQTQEKSKSKSMQNLATIRDDLTERNIKSDADFDFKIPNQPPEPIEFPVTVETRKEKMVEKSDQKTKKQKRINLSRILDRKKKKGKDEKKSEERTIPSISSSLKDLKESGQSDTKEKSDDDKSDFLFDSPQYTVPVQNGKIYVQSNNGFYIVDREDILKNDSFGLENMDNEREIEDSTVKTAIGFQKYWSRFMVYFHGVSAGFAFSHAATVTGIMVFYNYEPIDFINIYSCLSLKIHFIFYTLTTFCLVSCFDRVDIGHMNLKHWQVAWKTPSMWIALILYFLSFLLTFSNQKAEARFDVHYNGNETQEQIWQTEGKTDIQIGVLTWYHTVWIRDSLLLVAWLIISITEFPDYMYNHLNNMAKYININNKLSLSQISKQMSNL